MYISLKLIITLIIINFSICPVASAAVVWPGSCTQLFYSVAGGPYWTSGNADVYSNLSVGPSGALTLTGKHYVANANITSYRIQSYFFDSEYNNGAGQWVYAGYTQGYMDVVPPNALLVTGYGTTSLNAAANGCPVVNPCPAKNGQSVYDLKSNISESTPLPAMSCNDGCQVTSQLLWTQCINENIDCLSSVKYTFNGNTCSNSDPSLSDGLTPTPPNNCSFQINDKIAECGGSLNISSYNFENCTGTCVPDPCHEKWLALVNKCGGIMAVSNWNSQTCSGICANDPIVNPSPIDSSSPVPALPPTNINTNTKYNADGSKEVTQSVTNTYTNNTTNSTNTSTSTTTSVTTNTTTTYNSNGDQISQSTYTTTIHGTPTNGDSDSPTDPSEPPAEPNFPVPDSWYTPTYDYTKPLAQSINYQQVLSASSAFQQTAPYQITSLILDCLGYVSGSGCTYPPTFNVNLLSRFTSEPVKIDLSPFSSVVTIMKFFFSLLCLVGTGKLVMNLFS